MVVFKNVWRQSSFKQFNFENASTSFVRKYFTALMPEKKLFPESFRDKIKSLTVFMLSQKSVAVIFHLETLCLAHCEASI